MRPGRPATDVLPGQTYGALTILREDAPAGRNRYVVARCACGVEKRHQAHRVRVGTTTSCGCARPPPESRRIDRCGEVHGRLTVLDDAPGRSYPRRVRVRCECGQERVVQYGNLAAGNTVSCGCAARDLAAGRSAAARDRVAARLAELPALVGTRLGDLTVVAADPAATPTHHALRLRCACGAEQAHLYRNRDRVREAPRCRRCHPPNGRYVAIGGAAPRPLSVVAREHGVSRQLLSIRIKGGMDPRVAATTPPDPRFRGRAARPSASD